jgi:hypothetical protein
MQMLSIPASYDVWLTELKAYLDDHRGSQMEMARYLAPRLKVTIPSAQVKLSRIITGQRKPEVDMFLELSHWLHLQREKNVPQRKLVRYTLPDDDLDSCSRVAETPPG